MLRDEGRLSRDGRPPKEPPPGAGRQGGPGGKNLDFRLRPSRFRAGPGGGEVGETLGHGGGQLAGRELALEKKARHPHPVAERLWEIVLSS